MKYVGIIGNNSLVSTNRTLMQHLATRFGDRAEIDLVEIRDLPAFQAVEDHTAPAPIQAVIDQIAASDGVIIATPEYDHTIPAALKSLLEWLSFSTTVMAGKPVMIVGASHGRLGTSRAQDHLRQILACPGLRAHILPAEFLLGGSLQAFDEAGALIREEDGARLDAVFAEFEKFAAIVKQIEAPKEGR